MTARWRLQLGRGAGLGLLAFGLVACGVSPWPGEQGPSAVAPRITDVQPAPQLDPRFDVSPVSFDALPGWDQGDHVGVIHSLRETCPDFTPDDPRNDVAAPESDRAWIQACRTLDVGEDTLTPDHARTLIETAFEPKLLSSPVGDLGLVTAYYEPTIEARRTPMGSFTEPILRMPADLEIIRTRGDDGAVGEQMFQRRADGSLAPYPARADILAAATPGDAIGYGRLADVVFLQIQGSGRLEFADGSTVRAAFAATNGQDYVSIVDVLVSQGALRQGEASNAAVKRWLNAAEPDVARAAADANPRYVFFDERAVGDEALGPVGNADLALRAGVSMAVDPSWHDYGAVYWISPEGPGAPAPRFGLAQDKGAAIKGPLRGDLFIGSGDAAGRAASRVRHEAEWWALVPRGEG